MKYPNIIIPDTSLAAIVRDEKINPAGGIVDFIDSTVPFVEEAVVVDTGSEDGTREILEELTAKYPNLRVFDKKFNDYSSCRNHSLKKVRTKRALVLDADERLTIKDFIDLKKFLEDNPYEKGYKFSFTWIYPDSSDDKVGGCHNPRLFELSRTTEYKNAWKYCLEHLYYCGTRMYQLDELNIDTGIVIKHFCPEKSAKDKKTSLWYRNTVEEGKAHIVSPSLVTESREWMKYNSKREDYKNPSPEEVVEYLQKTLNNAN